MRLSLRIVVAVALIGTMLIGGVSQSNAVSELPSIEWHKTFSGFGKSIIQTADGGYAIAGYSLAFSFDAGANLPSALLIKTGLSGEFEWEKAYGSDVFGDNASVVSVAQTDDLGYMLIGEGGHLVKLDSEGNVQWKTALEMEGACTGLQTSDGYYLVAGNKKEITGEEVAWLLKSDEQGNIFWNKTFTGGIFVRAVIETNDRGCALAGNWKNSFWFAKIDYNNNLEWSQTYSYGEAADTHYVSSIVKTKDGGYLLAGTGDWQASGGMVPWLIKINSQGHERWNLPYPHIPHNGYSSAAQTDDEGYVLALNNSPILIRTDASGSEKWNLVYGNMNGAALYPLSSSLTKTNDTGYAVISTVTGGITSLTKISPEPDVSPPIVSILSPQNRAYGDRDISLTFTINEPTSWIGCSLDGQDNVTIISNVTLSELSKGSHNVTLYAEDVMGNIGVSETIRFSITDGLPVGLILAGVVAAIAIVVGLLFYFRRESLLALKKHGLRRHLKRQHFIAFMENRLVRTLGIIVLCVLFILVQLFFPFFYFSSINSSSRTFEVGVTYVYEQDDTERIYDEVLRIHDLGISVIRINRVSDADDTNKYLNGMTEIFFAATQKLGMKVALIIQNQENLDELHYYLGRWGQYLSYVQILNEPESASSWDVGALFTDDEAVSKFQLAYSVVEQYRLSAQLYTNFGAGFIARSNLPIEFGEKLDFIGFDVFMESFLVLSPSFVQLLQKITNKDIVITEFGMSTNDDDTQSEYIVRGLNLFKNMGIRGCWLVYWNSAADYYGIRDRTAEKMVGEWIAQNS